MNSHLANSLINLRQIIIIYFEQKYYLQSIKIFTNKQFLTYVEKNAIT